jgi:hypothetical protein
MKSNITCTRCGTVTTWTPYCPGCGAYLEFAGDPPWMPEPRIPDDDAEGAGYQAGPVDDDATPTATAGTTTAAASSTTPPPRAPATAPATDAVPTPPATGATGPNAAPVTEEPDGSRTPDTADTSSAPARPQRRFGGVDPWWRFWDRPEDHRESAAPPAPAPATPEGPREGDESAPFTYVVVAPDVPATVSAESPARQEEAQKRTIPVGRPDDLGVPGGIPCPQCRFRNYVDASYCARCGYALRSAVPETWTPSTVLAPSEKPPRRTDWSFLLLVGLGILVIVAIFFAPPGKPVRETIGNGIRSFAYWLDPDLGTPATVDQVEATSTGYGNPATSIVGDDPRTFWASAPSASLGAGTAMTFTFTQPTMIDRMVIRPGIQNGQFAVRALATPENLTLIFVALDSEPPDPSASPSGTESAASAPGSPSEAGSTSPSPRATEKSPSPSATKKSPSPNATEKSPSPSSTGSPSPSGTGSPSPTPTPTATPSVQASLPMIVEPTDWTTVVTFPAVYTEKVTLRIDSVFPPALPDTYTTNGDGQVAITAIQFLQKWDLGQLFSFSFRQTATPVPTPTPSGSPSSSESPSPQTSTGPSSSSAPAN